MPSFVCDYAEGAHPAVLERLCATNLEQTAGYGEDPYCHKAQILIRTLCATDGDVHFLIGGTQVNTAIIAAALRPHQGVLCADNGHIAVHETGGVEASGHKVLALPGHDGKLTADQVALACDAHARDEDREHTVQPGMVYLSQPTEFGTLYSLDELRRLSDVCRSRGLWLYVDGARMSYGLAAAGNDLELPDFARLCDAFTLGGTKAGTLFGEALVITAPALQKDFRYIMKQRGALLAKGRLLGLQFLALLEDGLYLRLAAHANTQALRLADAFCRQGCALHYPSPTNQQFPTLTPRQAAALAAHCDFARWATLPDGRLVARFCTSWATRPDDVDTLIGHIEAL